MLPPLPFFIASWTFVGLLGPWAVGIEPRGAAELKAGVARVDLTPPLELNAPLGGYGERMNRPAEGRSRSHFCQGNCHRLMAKQKFALVTVDIVGFPPPVKPALIERLGAGWTSEPDHAPAQPFAYQHRDERHQSGAILCQVPQFGIYNARVYEFVVERLVRCRS